MTDDKTIGLAAISAVKTGTGRVFARLLFMIAFTLFVAALVAGLFGVEAFGAPGSAERYSPLFAASLRDTLREFDEKEQGIYYAGNNTAVAEPATVRDVGATPVSVAGRASGAITTSGSIFVSGAPDFGLSAVGEQTDGAAALADVKTVETEEYYGIPGIPSVTSGYSCGATCGSTCGATCGSTCGATCGSTCGSTCSATCVATCGSTCTSTCAATCSATCGSTCGSTCTSTCAATCTATCSSTCGSTCAGSTCTGSSTCIGANTCAGMTTCAGGSTCYGSSTCFGSNTCQGSNTCVGNSTCVGSSTCVTGYTCSVTGPSGCTSALPPSGGSSQTGTGSSDTGSQPTSDNSGSSEPLDEALGDEANAAASGPPSGEAPGDEGAEEGQNERQPGESGESPGEEPSGGEQTEQPGAESGAPTGDESGAPPVDEVAPDADEPDDWAIEEVAKAIEAGYVSERLQSGYKENITRLDFCETLMYVLHDSIDEELLGNLSYYGLEPSPFTDIDDAIVSALAGVGIVQGVGEGLFNPDGEITRQEAAVMLHRAALALGAEDGGTETLFEDRDLVADWAIDALAFIVDKEIMKGVGDNRFDPLGTYTRQQAYITMIRLADAVLTYG